jgi:serine protease inhibitor
MKAASVQPISSTHWPRKEPTKREHSLRIANTLIFATEPHFLYECCVYPNSMECGPRFTEVWPPAAQPLQRPGSDAAEQRELTHSFELHIGFDHNIRAFIGYTQDLHRYVLRRICAEILCAGFHSSHNWNHSGRYSQLRLQYFIYRMTALICLTGVLTMLSAAQNNSDLNMLVKDNTIFALNLYQNLRESNGNLFFSPHSISTVLSMAYAGAKGNTEVQMAKVLHYSLPQQTLHPTFALLNTQLKNKQPEGKIELNQANALWVHTDSKFLKEFLERLETNYESQPFEANFQTNQEAIRSHINAWVEDQTQQKIRDFIQPGAPDPSTRLLLVNAIYFKGDWVKQFDKRQTRMEPFWLTSEQSVEVSMMTQKSLFHYAEDERAQILQLPYVGDDLSMVVLLPRQKGGLRELEKALTPKNLETWLEALKEREVQVFLPKFTMTSRFDLSRTLVAMGMADAFGHAADFSGMDGTKALYISAVIHQAFVEVSEQGTEAAAASGVSIGTKAFMQPPVFRADHPFVLIIHNHRPGSLLFLGRVSNPTAS